MMCLTQNKNKKSSITFDDYRKKTQSCKAISEHWSEI